VSEALSKGNPHANGRPSLPARSGKIRPIAPGPIRVWWDQLLQAGAARRRSLAKPSTISWVAVTS